MNGEDENVMIYTVTRKPGPGSVRLCNNCDVVAGIEPPFLGLPLYVMYNEFIQIHLYLNNNIINPLKHSLLYYIRNNLQY